MGGLIAGVILSLFLWPPIQLDVQNDSKKKLALYYLARLLCLCLYALLLGILVHHFTTSKIDEVIILDGLYVRMKSHKFKS